MQLMSLVFCARLASGGLISDPLKVSKNRGTISMITKAQKMNYTIVKCG